MQVRVSLIPPPPPPPSQELPGWSPDVWASSADPTRKVFCNRSLNMASIKVGESPSRLCIALLGREDEHMFAPLDRVGDPWLDQ